LLSTVVAGQLAKPLARLQRDRLRFSRAVEHRQQSGTHEQPTRMRGLRQQLVELAQQLVCRLRTEQQCGTKVKWVRGLPAG
jgi:hypothetical protein